MRLLDPKNDFVFKRLFADAPDLLAALINAVRSTEPPVEVVEVLNPRIEPEELTGKFIVLDVLAQDSQGRRYNIEMQVRRQTLAGGKQNGSNYLSACTAGARAHQEPER